jgi:hypothetical protein
MTNVFLLFSQGLMVTLSRSWLLYRAHGYSITLMAVSHNPSVLLIFDQRQHDQEYERQRN